MRHNSTVNLSYFSVFRQLFGLFVTRWIHDATVTAIVAAMAAAMVAATVLIHVVHGAIVAATVAAVVALTPLRSHCRCCNDCSDSFGSDRAARDRYRNRCRRPLRRVFSSVWRRLCMCGGAQLHHVRSLCLNTSRAHRIRQSYKLAGQLRRSRSQCTSKLLLRMHSVANSTDDTAAAAASSTSSNNSSTGVESAPLVLARSLAGGWSGRLRPPSWTCDRNFVILRDLVYKGVNPLQNSRGRLSHQFVFLLFVSSLPCLPLFLLSLSSALFKILPHPAAKHMFSRRLMDLTRCSEISYQGIGWCVSPS